MTECLSCEEIQTRICELLAEISTLEGCQGITVEDSGVKFNYSQQLTSKYKALDVLEKLEERRCPKGAGELYSFTHVPCVRPATCVGTSCTTTRQQSRNRRRYR